MTLKRRQTAWALAALLLIPASGRASEYCGHDQAAQQRGAQQQPPAKPGDKSSDKPGEHRGPTKWWIDPQLRAELQITEAQSKDVEDIWQKSVPKLRDGRTLLEKQEEALSQMIRSDASETAVIAQIDKVENMRAELSKARAVMIYRMNRLLTPEQRDKVKAMMERRDGGRRDPSAK
jgi:Spy/CpxP family protein refolding chaperone